MLRVRYNQRDEHDANNNNRTLQHDSYQQFTKIKTSFPFDGNRKNVTTVRDLANRIRLWNDDNRHVRNSNIKINLTYNHYVNAQINSVLPYTIHIRMLGLPQNKHTRDIKVRIRPGLEQISTRDTVPLMSREVTKLQLQSEAMINPIVQQSRDNLRRATIIRQALPDEHFDRHNTRLYMQDRINKKLHFLNLN